MSLFPSPAASAFADVLIALLEDDRDDWKLGNHTLDHPSGLSIWISNGFWFCSLYRPEELKFGWKKIPLWRACKVVMRGKKKMREMERIVRVHKNLIEMKDNVVAFRAKARGQ